MGQKTSITPEFRAAYINVFKARAQKDDEGNLGAAKFSIRAMFPPTADLSALKQAAGAAAAEKWGNAIPKSLRSPFRRNEELDNPVEGLGPDWIVMTFSANEDRKPGLVDNRNQDILDESECYSGAWYRAEVRPYGYEHKGNKGVSFGLQNVQKLREGDPIGGGRTPASKVFDAVADAGPQGAPGALDAEALFR